MALKEVHRVGEAGNWTDKYDEARALTDRDYTQRGNWEEPHPGASKQTEGFSGLQDGLSGGSDV